MTWLYLIILIAIVPILFLFITNKKIIKEEPNFIHIFPDYPRGNPCIVKAGQTINFIAKGYKDIECLEEVELKNNEISWQHQNYVGKFIFQKANVIHYQIPDKKEKIGKEVYIAVTYHKLKDATWLKIAT